MTRDQRARVILAPLAIWAALLALVGLTILYAYIPHAPGKTWVALLIALAKVLLIALLFMQLRTAAGMVRVAAVIGIVWATFLYLFSFADFLTR